MATLDDKMSEALDVAPVQNLPPSAPLAPLIPIEENKDVDADYNYARSNLYNLIDKGNEAVDAILEVARESQHPRAFEVAANMLKHLSDMNDKLLALQKSKRDLMPNKQDSQTSVNVDKAVFVGSTAELLKMIKNESNKELPEQPPT